MVLNCGQFHRWHQTKPWRLKLQPATVNRNALVQFMFFFFSPGHALPYLSYVQPWDSASCTGVMSCQSTTIDSDSGCACFPFGLGLGVGNWAGFALDCLNKVWIWFNSSISLAVSHLIDVSMARIAAITQQLANLSTRQSKANLGHPYQIERKGEGTTKSNLTKQSKTQPIPIPKKVGTTWVWEFFQAPRVCLKLCFVCITWDWEHHVHSNGATTFQTSNKSPSFYIGLAERRVACQIRKLAFWRNVFPAAQVANIKALKR